VGFRLLCAGAGLALLASACGSSKKKSATATTTPQAGVSGVTDGEVVVDIVASITSPQGAALAGFEDGARARIEDANRSGGVAGRKIRLANVYDDGSDAGKNLDGVKKAVLSDKAFAVLATGPTFLPQSSDYLAQNRVPYVGWGFVPGYCKSDWGFGFNGCLISQTTANESLVKGIADALGKKVSDLKYAFQAGDDQSGHDGNRIYDFLVKKEGGKVVYNQANVPTQTQTTDYSPFVQAIMATSPDVVIVSTAFGDAIGLTGTLKAKGFKGAVMNFVAYVPGLLQASANTAQALNGGYVNSQIPPQESQTAAIKHITDDLTAIGKQPFVTLGGAIAYWSADVLIHMLDKVGRNLTRDTFQSTINGGFHYQADQDGGIGPLDYPRNHNEASPCAAILQVKGTAYTPVLPFKCYTNLTVS
jgi:ABC-type branched-subunit amino acid transport system substrate-binding protein